MNQEEKEKYSDLIMSMSLDFKMGKISWETYTKNLEWISKKLSENA